MSKDWPRFCKRLLHDLVALPGVNPADAVPELASEFPIAAGITYLDHAALSPLPCSVKRAIDAFHNRRMRRGADFTAWWERAERVRALVAGRINAAAGEIAFTANTSMGINLAAAAIPFEPGDNVVISDEEFPSNVYPWMNLDKNGVELRCVHCGDGEEIERFRERIDARTRAVSVSWVTSGTGRRLDIAALGALCKRNRSYFIVDAMQGIGVLPLDVRAVQADFVVSGFFKWLLGPDGIAFIYIRQGILDELQLPYAGWAGVEDRFNYTTYRFAPINGAGRFETGNLNFSALYGVEAAMSLVSGLEPAIQDRVLANTAYLRQGLSEIPRVTLLSPRRSAQAAGITLFTTTGDDEVARELRAQRVVVSYRNGIRVSPHFYTSTEQLDTLLTIVRSTVGMQS